MTRTLRVTIALLIVSLLTPVSGFATVANAQGTYCATEAEAEMLRRINELRQGNGLQPLQLSRPLGVAADIKAQDMAERDYLTHVSPDGQGPRDLLDDAGYTSNVSWGENIAAGNEGAGATFEQWLNSPSHLETMLGEQYTAIGIGSAYNADSTYGWYWATEFGGVVGEPAGPCGSAPPATSPFDVNALIAVLIAILADILG